MALSNAEKQRRWRERHRSEIEAKRKPRASRVGEGGRYQVVEVRDEQGIPRYIGMQRIGESLAARAWGSRHKIENRLMQWLRSLDAPPVSRVLLGSAVPLTWQAARALMRFRRNQVAAMAGTEGPPDFALWPAVHRGGAGHPRPVCRVRGETVERFPSIGHAARSLGTSHDDVDERVETGLDAAGWAWWDSEG